MCGLDFALADHYFEAEFNTVQSSLLTKSGIIKLLKNLKVHVHEYADFKASSHKFSVVAAQTPESSYLRC